jgi:hypothetical protein
VVGETAGVLYTPVGGEIGLGEGLRADAEEVGGPGNGDCVRNSIGGVFSQSVELTERIVGARHGRI